MIRVKIKSWTATFRYPTFQSGYQPTLPLPPLSTILGLLSAAKGDIINLNDIDFVGYIFINGGKGVDLERTHLLDGRGKGIYTDITKREILFDNILYLYLPNTWEKHFRNPKYQLLLGRSSDLLSVDEIKKVKLEKKEGIPIGGTIIPLELKFPGIIHSLVIEYDYSTLPRNVKAVKPFTLVPYSKNLNVYPEELPFDEELGLGVMLYDKSLLS
jgi:CRISPR-associated protein Cas5t